MRFSENRERTSKRLVNIYAVNNQKDNKTFSSLWMTQLTRSEIDMCFREDQLLTGILMLHWWKRNNYSATFSTHEKLRINPELT